MRWDGGTIEVVVGIYEYDYCVLCHRGDERWCRVKVAVEVVLLGRL